MRGRGAAVVVFASLLIMFGATFAQTGSDWQYFNVFNLVEGYPSEYPGTGPGGVAQIPSWYLPGFSSVASFTPARENEWVGYEGHATATIEETPVYGLWGIDMESTPDEDLIRVRTDRAVLRLDLRAATDRIRIAGMKVTMWGTYDFDPNEDIAPINPQHAYDMFYPTYITASNPDSAKNYYTGLQFYVDEWRVTDHTKNDIFDETDINAVVEQLGINNRTHDVNIGEPDAVTWAFDTMPGTFGPDGVTPIYDWVRAPALDRVVDGHQLYAWQTTIYFENSIVIPSALDPAEYLPFRRIWIALQTTGCHGCVGENGGIEGVSDLDTFYIGFTGPDDFYAYVDDDRNHRSLPPLGHVEVEPDRSAPSNPEAERWSRAEPIIGQDTIPPFIYALYPDNRVGSNGPHSDLQGVDGMTAPFTFDTTTTHEWGSLSDPMHSSGDQYIYTADSTQFISFKVKDQQTCIDYVVVELRYVNGGGFPCRVDSIYFWNPLEFPEHGHGNPPETYNGGNGNGWLGAISTGHLPGCAHDHNAGACPPISIAHSGYELDWIDVTGTNHEIGVVHDLRDTCGLDSFWIAVGNNVTEDELDNFIDGAIVQVTVRAFNRNYHTHFDTCEVGGGNFAEIIDYSSYSIHWTEKQWQFVVDLSAPTAELICPTNSYPSSDWLDNETKEFYNYSSLPIPCSGTNYNRSDQIEGVQVPYTWLADSLPLFHIKVYDDYSTVHDVINHGPTYPNGAGGSGFNLRDFEITFTILREGVGSEETGFFAPTGTDVITVTEADLIPYDVCACTPGGGTMVVSAPGVYYDEADNGQTGDLYVSFENIFNTHAPFRRIDADLFRLNSGDKVYIEFTRFFDDPDFGQGSQKPTDLDPGSIDLQVSGDASWCGAAGFSYNGNDPNYGTNTMEENHIPVMAEPDAFGCPGYAGIGYHPDTLGILRIDLVGPTAPDSLFYPPNNWVTSDTLQVITVDLFDLVGFDNVDQPSYYDDLIADGYNPRFYGVSGVHKDSIIMNIKVRGCDGSWHPAYGGASGRNFIINDDDITDLTGHPRSEPNTVDPAGDENRNLVIEKIRYHNATTEWWGNRVVFDPTADPTGLKFRPGDEVCVTVYAADNAYTSCTEDADGFGPCPWCEGGEEIAGYWYDGTPKDYFPFRHFVQGMNWAKDTIDPDAWPDPVVNDRQVARFTFYVDPTPPTYEVTNFEQCPFEARFWITDISDRVGPLWCDEHVANIGALDLFITTTDDEDCDGDSVNNSDTIFVNDIAVGESLLIYHDGDHLSPCPGTGFTAYWGDDMAYCVLHDPCCTTWVRQDRKLRVRLDRDPDDPERTAILTLRWADDGPDDCHFFEPYDNVNVEIYAGDEPNTPWFPATARPEPWAGPYTGASGPDYYAWYHDEDCFTFPTDACDQYDTWITVRGQRCTAHTYAGAGGVVYNYGCNGLVAQTYTQRCDFENPNWNLVHTENFTIQPSLDVTEVRWFNDSAWVRWNAFPPELFRYPPDLSGLYSDMEQTVGYDWVIPSNPISDSDTADMILSNGLVSTYVADEQLDDWTKGLNFITFEVHTCTDSIIWECRAGDHPYSDSVVNHSPYARVVLFDSTGTEVWSYEDWYDCDCEHCWLHYTPLRDTIALETHGCVDGGILQIGPINQLGAVYDTLIDSVLYYDTLLSDWVLVDADTNVYWGGPVLRIDPRAPEFIDDYRDSVENATGDSLYITWDAPVYGYLNNDSLVVIVRFATRNANQFGYPDADTIADYHYYSFAYRVDMEPPTARFSSLVATTGYEEVNCNLRHDTNHTIRVRLESILDSGVGCSGGGSDVEWSTTWPLPAVVEGSDVLRYLYHPDLDESLDLVYNPGTYYLYTNESLVIHNCSDENQIARIMTLASPITLYHGVERGTGTVYETVLNEDTMFIADSLWAEAIVQDRLGNSQLVQSNPMGLDNGLPFVKGIAFCTAIRETTDWDYEYDTTGAIVDSTPVIGDIVGFTEWDPSLFRLPWDPDVATQDSLIGVFNFEALCTVFVRVWFNDHMDMRDIDPLTGHIVRFRPEGWTHWFPVIPISTTGGFFPLAQRYADYNMVGDGPIWRAVAGEGAREDFERPDLELADIEPGWNTDREWIGYMIIAGDDLMDGVATLRIQGFDDNAGNVMLDHEYMFRIETDYAPPTIGWPTPENYDNSENHDWEDPYNGGQRTITGYEDAEECDATFEPVSFCNEITAYDFDPTITDSVVFLVYYHDTTWSSVPDGVGEDYHYNIDDLAYSPDIWYDAGTGYYFARIPCDSFDLAVDAGTGATYASIEVRVYSRFYPDEYVKRNYWNLYIDNEDLACDQLTLSEELGDVYPGDDTLIFPITTEEIEIVLEGEMADEVDYVELVLINMLTGLEFSITGGYLPVTDTSASDSVIWYNSADSTLEYTWDCEGDLLPGLYYLEWRATNEITVQSGVTSPTGSNTVQHNVCCQRDYVLVPRESFLARGDNLDDALMRTSCNYDPGIYPWADDIYPWIDEDFYPDYPAWVDVDSSIVDERDYMHRFQITTFNNPDYTSGDMDPFNSEYIEQGGYMGDSLYVLFEIFPSGDSLVDSIWLDIEDELGGDISGSNRALHLAYDIDDTVGIVDCLGDTHYYFIYPWTLDDQENRYDGPAEIRVTLWEHRAGAPSDAVSTVHPTYVLLDTYDPEYSVNLLRYAGGAFETMYWCYNDDYPGEKIWVTNADTVQINVTWLQTIFDQAPTTEGYVSYDEYSYSRNWDFLRMTIDGMPHYGYHTDDPNDYLEVRLWHKQLDPYFLTYPFWYQPEGGYDALATDVERWNYFIRNTYSYMWVVADDPTGNGLAKILVKGRDAAGNILGYEEAEYSRSEGKFVLIDTDPPTIDDTLVTVTVGSFEADAEAIDDNLLGGGYYDPATGTYVLVEIYDAPGGTMLAGPFAVEDDGSVEMQPATIDADSVYVCATDLAGNMDCAWVEVQPELVCCSWDLCAGWNYVALSVVPEDATAGAVFGQAVYTMCDTHLIEYDVTDVLDLEYGYMVFAPAETTIEVCGTPLTISDFRVHGLCAGWNLIGAPWSGAPVSAISTDPSGVLLEENVLEYNCSAREYEPVLTLNSCKGHLVFVDEPCSLWIDTSKSVTALKKRFATPLWAAKLNVVSTDNEFNRTLTLGVADGGTENFDAGADVVIPPAFPGEMDARIGAHFVADYRAEDTRITWTLTSRGGITLTSELGEVPDDYDVYIRYKEDLINLREVTELILPAGDYEVVVARKAIPTAYKLGKCFPNPFNAATVINYELPEKARVKIEVFDLSGHKVTTLLNDEQSAGYRSVVWNGTDDSGNDVASGIYFYRLTTDSFRDTKRMILSK
ncbi:hypothetical protein DRQ33_00115 [bacterium]|nr:MAG: hypothetical protein DRQ33_00115 [bacterium]